MMTPQHVMMVLCAWSTLFSVHVSWGQSVTVYCLH